MELQQYLAILSRRRWILFSFFAMVVGAAAAGAWSLRPVYRATALVLIEKERPGYRGDYQERVDIESSQEDYYQTQYRILTSRSLARETLMKLALDRHPEFSSPDPVQTLLGHIRVEPVRFSRLVNVHAESADPVLATAIANTLSQSFVGKNLESKSYLSREALDVVDQGTAVGERRRSRPRATREAVSLEALPSVVNHPLIRDLKAELARLGSMQADLGERYGPRHPKRKRVDSQIRVMRTQLEREVRNISESVKEELAGGLEGNNVRIIDLAETPKAPIRPDKPMILALAMFFGLLLGGALALGVDRLDQTIKSQEDIEGDLKLPFFGQVTHILSKQGGAEVCRHAHDCPEGVVTESLRHLRTAVSFSLNGGSSRSLMVTSSQPGEGKTTLAANLAIVFAQAGERVLLVDGDMRRPGLHTVFGIQAPEGLSHVLAAKSAPASVVRTTDVPGLSLLPCGVCPPNPSELLSTRRWHEFLEWASAEFDRVIVDTSPLLPVTDTHLMARHAAGVLLVVRYGKTNPNVARRACQRLRDAQANIIGAALNDVSLGSMEGYLDYPYYAYQRPAAHKRESPLEPQEAA